MKFVSFLLIGLGVSVSALSIDGDFCSQTKNKVSLFKENNLDNTYELVFENLSPSSTDRPDWVDAHIRSPAIGEANVRLVSDGMTSRTVSQPGLVVRPGETLTHFVTYGKFDGTACNTKIFEFERPTASTSSSSSSSSHALLHTDFTTSSADDDIETATATDDEQIELNAAAEAGGMTRPSSRIMTNPASAACPPLKLTRKLVAVSGLENTYKLIFTLPTNMPKFDYIELHYALNDQSMTNLRIGNSLAGGSIVSQDGIVIRPHDTLRYFATYAINGIQCDTHMYSDKMSF